MKNGKKLLITFFILVFSFSFLYFLAFQAKPLPVFNKFIKKKTASHKIIKNNRKVYRPLKFLTRENSTIIKLNDRFSFLPFHPIKLKLMNNKIFYLDKGNLYFFDLKIKFVTPKKIALNNSKELVDITINPEKNTIYLLDKLNNIYSFNAADFSSKTRPKNIYKSRFTGSLPDPEFVNIFFDNLLFILDTARNQVFFEKTTGTPQPLFTKVFMEKLPEARDFTSGIAIYREKGLTYILKRADIIDVYGNNNFLKRIKIREVNQYGYLGIFSAPQLKNLYLTGGYRGTVTAISKNSGKIAGEYYIRIKKQKVPVFDVFIDKKTMYILAGNYLLIQKNFKEADFEKTNYGADEDLLFSSIDNEDIWNFIIPLKLPGVKLPDNAGMYPGARRLYRYGIHEGTDFFSDKNIIVDQQTPVIAAQDGMIVRADLSYHEMTIKEHEKILKQCEINYQTSPEHADKLRGRQVRILHNGNLVTVYAHLSKIAPGIKPDKYIRQGEIIGYVGNSGTTDGVYQRNQNLHLHFETHIDDQSLELEYYLGKFLTIEETMQIYKRILH